ncbi:NADH dehydrogenase [ubiquinone] 1 alpha subcomplex assembly factor 3 [Athalia rosae]|uniref:NADH dehydrogenase [ubiquinone] 1 alpha subcomplex assembly factor 3 n=1 Tax=Athalia rosae TaxID=37344 RepID=UPI0020340C4B|nr:NADH dehydrogenase [ubiquinone] 1 alpha subcomplex assembly factor 3 [Athalia rosae]
MKAVRMFSRLISANIKQSTRKFHGSPIVRDGAYEGDGKTTLSILNKDFVYGLMIDSYSESGFTLNNGIRILGPIALFPRSILNWRVSGIAEINAESLSLFAVLEPRPDVLVIGIGNYERTTEFNKFILRYSKEFNINMEVVPTNQACAMFNFLNAEGRFVAAALLPPHHSELMHHEKMDHPDGVKVLESSVI